MNAIYDSLVQTLRDVARDEIGDVRAWALGRVAAYDGGTNSVQCTLPSYRTATGTPVTTDWVPLGTGMAGSGYGIQCALNGGEQCWVGLADPATGLACCAVLFWGVNAPPYGSNLPAGSIGITPASGGTVNLGATSGGNLPTDKAVVGTTYLSAEANFLQSIGADPMLAMLAPVFVAGAQVYAALHQAGAPTLLSASVNVGK